MEPHVPPRGRGLVAIDGAMALIVCLLVIQMWLLTTTLQSYLAGYPEVALPAALTSGLLLAGCAALYAFVCRVDREVRRAVRQPEPEPPSPYLVP